MIFSVISNREVPKIEKLIHTIDPESFMVVNRVSEVSGRGFSMKNGIDKNIQIKSRKTGLNLLTFCRRLCYFKFRYQGVVHTGFWCCAGRHHAAG